MLPSITRFGVQPGPSPELNKEKQLMKQLPSSCAGVAGNARSGKEGGSFRVGIDVGGSRIKAGVVDTAAGVLTAPAVNVPTPQPATPKPSPR